MPDTLWIGLGLVLLVGNVLLLLWLALRRPGLDPVAQAQHQQLVQVLQQQGLAQDQRIDRLEAELRRELVDGARAGRQELGATLTQTTESLNRQAAEATRTQNAQLDAFAQQLVQLRAVVGDTLTQQLQAMSDANARRLAEVRQTLDQQQAQLRSTLEAQLTQLQQSNTAKLDEMRHTVDEKLQSTLQARLG